MDTMHFSDESRRLSMKLPSAGPERPTSPQLSI
jgi:hypothetical protein